MPSWRCCAATPPTGCRVYPASARRPPRHYWRSTARWRGSWPPSTTPNRRCPRVLGPSCATPPTTSKSPAPWCGWPPTRLSRYRRRPTPCRWWRPTRRGPPSWRPGSGSRPRSRGCKRRSTRCPGREVFALLGPADLVGALVVLEGHRDLTLGAVDADVTVEGGALFNGRILAVVALDVFDVLRPVAVGVVAENLRHTSLRLIDVQLGGHEEPRRPEAQHQYHRHDDGGEHPDHRANDRPRLLRAGVRGRLAVGPRVLGVLTRLAVLSRLPPVRVLLRVARGLRERLRRRVVLRRRLLVLSVIRRRVRGGVPCRLLSARRLPGLLAGWLLLPG